MSILDKITIGDNEINIVDVAPNISGISGNLGSLAFINDGTGIFLKTDTPITAWSKQIGVNNLSDITGVGTITSGVWQGSQIADAFLAAISWSKVTSTPTTLAGYGITNGLTNFSSGNLSPLFTTNVATPSSTPNLTFTLINANASTWFGENTGVLAPPTFNNLSALTGSNDTNVTISFSGNPTISLLNPVNITLGWTGILDMTRGGTGTSTLFTQNNVIFAGTGGSYTQNDSFKFDPIGSNLFLSGLATSIRLENVTNTPSTVSDSTYIFSRNIAGRSMPEWLTSTGVENIFQSSIAFSNISVIAPGSGTTLTNIGTTSVSIGTVSHSNPTTGNIRNQTRRFVITSAAAAGSFAGTRAALLECWRGNAAGLGGFFMVCRWSLKTLQNGNICFIGLFDRNNAPTNIDTLTDTTRNKIGVAINSNTGNWFFVNNVAGTAPTTQDLGAQFPVDTTSMYEVVIYAAPNSTSIGWKVSNLSNGAIRTGTLTTNIPENTTFLTRQLWFTNNTTAGAVALDCSKFYLESDY